MVARTRRGAQLPRGLPSTHAPAQHIVLRSHPRVRRERGGPGTGTGLTSDRLGLGRHRPEPVAFEIAGRRLGSFRDSWVRRGRRREGTRRRVPSRTLHSFGVDAHRRAVGELCEEKHAAALVVRGEHVGDRPGGERGAASESKVGMVRRETTKFRKGGARFLVALNRRCRELASHRGMQSTRPTTSSSSS
jgi:hypothetical protein